jgi:hypothetical protein
MSIKNRPGNTDVTSPPPPLYPGHFRFLSAAHLFLEILDFLFLKIGAGGIEDIFAIYR